MELTLSIRRRGLARWKPAAGLLIATVVLGWAAGALESRGYPWEGLAAWVVSLGSGIVLLMVASGLLAGGDRVFRAVCRLAAVGIVLLVLAILAELVANSMPSIRKFGIGFLFSTQWDHITGHFGAVSSIFGTLASTLIAMLLAGPLALLIALFLVELAPPWMSRIVGGAIELLAAIPSIIYGMWGMFIFAPYLQNHIQPAMNRWLGWTGLFSGPPLGIGLLPAGIILALMILPFITAVARDVFQMVPAVVKESAYGMGATTWEVTRKVTLRYGARGIAGGLFLGLGRAIGETMAVTFVIGNNHHISTSLNSSSNTISSTIANEFIEATDPIYYSSLVELGLVLLVMTMAINVIADLWLKRLGKSMGAL
ncbi:MAG: Phosphate transport system permease protein PstC [Phycisphaerae bacterium]|nr:Phosphate transport system permease protein PstC [Phycisphaerae bacterium]